MRKTIALTLLLILCATIYAQKKNILSMSLPPAAADSRPRRESDKTLSKSLPPAAADSTRHKVTGIENYLSTADNVSQDRMNKGLITSSLDALSGKAVGVSVSSGSDRMAMLSSVRVRGTTSLTGGNDPLVIIDGVYSDLTTLIGIYPADIESFSILKNAAETAPFGSRGASGVIVVNTKKGESSKFHISYDGNIGIESVYKQLDMLNRNEYVSTAKRLGLSYNDGGYDTDFLKSITRIGYVHNHHVAFSGGTEQSNYRASIGFMDHKTVIKVNEYKNFAAKLDLSQKAFDDLLTINMGVIGSSQNNHYIFDQWKLFYSAASMNPTLSDEMNAGGGWDCNTNASQINNPNALLKEKDHEKNQNFNTHISLDIDLLGKKKRIYEELHMKVFGAYSYSSIGNAQYLPTWVWAQGQAYYAEKKTEDWLGNVSINYQNQWGAHLLELTAIAEYQKSNRSGFWTTVKGFTQNTSGYDNLGTGATIPFGGTGSNYDNPSLSSFMIIAKYDINNKYTFTGSLRQDGSSMVAKKHRWGLFPSISATWDAKKECFLKNNDIISLSKLRIGYGLSGNLSSLESYNSLTLLYPTGIVPWEGSNRVTYGIVSNVNPDLKWETRSTFNVGADFGFLNNRLLVTAEYYYSKTWDMLYQYDVPVPPFPYNKWVANIGEMSNQGVEIGIGAIPIQQKDMELDININMSFQKNKLISLSGDYNGSYMTAPEITPIIGNLNGAGFHGGYNNIVYQIIGQPLGVFYLPHCTGFVENNDGSYSYGIEDIDKNGKVNIEDNGDRYIAGQAMPKIMIGSNIAFRYKSFDISLQMNGAFGHKIYNGTALTYMNMASFPDYNVMTEAPEANIKDQTATDYWLERGDYLNFDYLTLGWNVPTGRNKYISSLRLSVSINNLATITSYSGLSPMINSSAVNSTLGIDDKRTYPPYRSYSLGVSIHF